MRNALAQRWFLLVLLAGVGLAGVRPEWLAPWLAGLPPLALVGPALFLMAWGLESRSLFRVFVRPQPALVAVAISYGPLPAAGWLAGRLLPDPDLAVGLMLITAVPCTLASAVLWTRRAGGNEATALLVVLLSTGTSWLVTTAWLVGGTGIGRVSVDPWDMMRVLLLALVVPVLLGQSARAFPWLARAAARHKVVVGVASQLLILTVIIKAAVEVSLEMRQTAVALPLGAIAAAAGLCLLIHLAAWASGFWGGRVLRFDRGTRIAVGFACSQKTLPVGLVLFEAYFRGDHPLAVLPVAFYHFGQLVVDTLIADRLAGCPRTAKEIAAGASV
ncbi:MAG TPA: bile acid:sodium symporter [Gemmataceae bacterium]|jgi:sodium/bile acid cotransporter 7|nr:bile acid:sodium symporter [Gemmataceae bacterium]